MKKLFVSALLLFASQPIFGALSPLNQSLEEIRSITQSSSLNQYLSQAEPVLEIRKIGNGYVIVTGSREMHVDVIYLKQEMPGPKKFKLIFHEPVELNPQ